MARLRHWLMIALLGVTLAAAPACQTSPATGRTQLNQLSTSQEIQIGTQAAPQFLEEYGGPIPSAAVRQYVADIGHRMADISERPDLPWEFQVVDSSTINAFALPGGKIFISRGLLERMDNEAQLAGVLGHEIGHVTDQHIGQQLTHQMMIQLGGVGLGIIGQQTDNQWLEVLGVGTQVGGTVYLLSFSRRHENVADELGMRYMTQVGYNPVGQLQMLNILAEEAARRGPGGIEFLSTHPLPQTRIDRVSQIIQSAYPDHDEPGRYRFGRDEYHQNVLARLEQLPPPQHSPEGAAPAPQE